MSDQYTEHHGQEDTVADVRADQADPRHEAVLAQLQRKILEGELAPGDRLPSEREMMDTFGVSWPTVREALRVAESLGLVAVRHGDPGGPRVLDQPSVGVTRVLDGLLSAERTSVAELLEARMVLEGAAARLAAQPGAELGPLEEAYRAMEQAADFARFVEADAVFHRRVAEVGGNRLLVVILTALRDPIVRLITEGLSGETEAQARAKILRTHGEILKAIRAGMAPRPTAALDVISSTSTRRWLRPTSGRASRRCWTELGAAGLPVSRGRQLEMGAGSGR